MRDYVTKVKELEPKVFMSCILRSIKNKELFPHRHKIGSLYKKYNSRQENKLDKESHLVKLIDMIQGDSFGLKNVYSKKRLLEIFNEDSLIIDPDEIMHKIISRSFSQLELVFEGINNQSDKKIIFDYFIESHFELYKNPEHGYQHIYDNFLSQKEKLFNSI